MVRLSRRARRTSPRPLALLAVALPLAACSGTGGGGPDPDSGPRVVGQVTLRDYRGGAEFMIVSDSWVSRAGYEGDTADARRAAFYSEARSGAQVKVCDDPTFGGILEALDRAGYTDHAVSGAAPVAMSGASYVVELREGDTITHAARRNGDDPARMAAVLDTYAALLEVFNALEQYQTVEGRVEFQNPTFDGGRRR